MTCEKMNTKVRLVRCPKCQLVLPELPEISVYKCGGCNTVLQAKHRKPDMKEADQNHESDENGLKEPDGVSSSTLSNENSAISTLDESSSSPRTSKIKDDNISDENMNTKQSQDEDSPLSPVRIEHEKDNTVSIPDSGQIENEFPTSTELTSNEMEDSSIELHNILGTENDTDDQYTEADETKREKTKRDYFESSNFSDDVCSVMLDSSPESRKKDGILDSNESPQDFKHEDSSDHHLPVVESTNSELRGKDLDFTKSPTRSYYACDLVPNRSSKPPRRKLKPSNGPLKRAESGIPSLLSSETEMRYCGYNNKSGLDDDDGLMSSESEIQHLSRKATFLEANSMTKVPSNRYERRDSGFLRPDTALLYNNVPDKLELLKTINELKDELNRTRISNPSFPSLEENQHTWPCHHHHHQPAPRFSRTAYSGEATGRANCTCFLPQARYYSGGVPLNGMCNYRTHHQFLQEHETKSQNVRQFPTQKDHSSKRYIIPEAGGIPILSCYHCSELLQFPADFLLSSRKCHKLKCNTCRKIMKFSLENRRHLVPYIPEHTVAPPPSMVDDYSQTSLPQNSNIHSTVKPGISIDRSSSIKSERIARAPREALKHGNMNKRNLTFGAFEPFNDDDHHHTRRNNSMETVGSSGNPKDLKEAPSTSGGGGAYRALHRLMGYASPSQVIRR